MSESVTQALDAVEGGAAATSLERDRLDFKVVGRSVKDAILDLAEAASCFANAAGGTIVVGVSDRPGGHEAFVGCDLDPAELRRAIYELTEPALMVDVQRLAYAGVDLVVVEVPEGLRVHASKKGVVTRRLGRSCLPMSPSEIARLEDDRSGLDWSAQVAGPVDDIDESAMRRLRELLAGSRHSAVQTLARGSDADVLSALGLVDHGRLTRAGQFLLVKSTEERLVYVYKRSRGGEVAAVRRWAPPMLLAFDDVLGLIDTRQNFTPVILKSGVQIEIEDYPSAAVREAVANALVHGDQRVARPVWVEHSPDALVVTSPGPLVAGMTADTILTSPPRSRFPLLTKVFRNLGLAEELGLGIDRMFREMVRSGRDTPLIEALADEVRVTFRGERPNARVAKVMYELPAEERENTDVVLILWMLCGRRVVSASTVASTIQRSAEYAQDVLHRMATEPLNLLEPTRGTLRARMPNYRLRQHVAVSLGAVLSYRRTDKAEVDLKVADHVREYGYINNSTLRRLFDVDVSNASDMIRDLVRRQLLVRVSEQTRGKAVRYGPGPKLPPRKRRKR